MSNSLIKIFQNQDVAIVGNSTSLFNQKNGNLIESTDIVCRLNKGIRIKDPIAQGRKTDVWAYGDFSLIESIFDNYNCQNTIHLSKNKRKQTTTKKNSKFFYSLNYLNLLEKRLNWEWPSSGLMLLDLVYNCNPKNIFLYGFDWKKTLTWHNTDMENSIKNVHNWSAEENIIKNFYLRQANIKLL